MKPFIIISLWEKMFSISCQMNLGLLKGLDWRREDQIKSESESNCWCQFLLKKIVVVQISYILMHHLAGFGANFIKFVSLAIFIVTLNINFLPTPITAG